MRNIFALIGLLVVGAACLGWYMGWYKVNFTKSTDGNLQIQTDVDTKKVSGDSSAFFKKVGQIVTEKTPEGNQGGTPGTTPASPPGNTPAGPQSTPQNSAPSIPPPPPFTPDR